MRIAVIILFTLLHFKGYSQKSIDGIFAFKLQLFLEKVNVINANGFDVKDDKLMNFFMNKVSLKLDTLQSRGFTGAYVFLDLSVKDGVIYNDKNVNSDSSFFFFVDKDCSNYILAVNKFTGKSYRLKGFSGNDFFNLFADVNKQSQYSSSSSISMKMFLRNYEVSGVDFSCLYSAIKSGDYDLSKYPCLKGCEARNIEIH